MGVVDTAAISTAEVVEVVCGASDEEEEEVDKALTDEEVAATALEPEPKLLLAVTEAPLLTFTSFTITTSPSVLVTLISTVVVPKPEDCSKKL